MTGIALPPNTVRIGGNAFEYCSSLTSVTGLDNVTSMGQSAFGGCTASIEELDFPSLGTWTNGAFNGARGVQRILLPKISSVSVNTAFQNCTGLRYLQLGSVGNGITVSSVGTAAFNGVTQTDLVVDCYTSSGLMDTLLSNMRTRGLTGAIINMKAAADLTYNGTAYAAGETVIQSVPE